MSKFGIYHPTRVITQRGLVEFNDILPGDYVYEYRTNEKLKVLEVVTPNEMKKYKEIQ